MGYEEARGLDLYSDLQLIRSKRPLVHEIINRVAVNDAVNVTLSLGGSPIVSQRREELEELVAAASAVYINIGTPDQYDEEAILHAARLAGKYRVPVVLDPVGAGATRLRTQLALDLLGSGSITVVKGNGGEMAALVGERGAVRGVDSLVGASKDVALKFSERFGVVAAVTGPIDHVAYGGRWASIEGGTSLFEHLTGTGCMAGAAVAAFLAVDRDGFKAALGGLATFKAAGTVAAKASRGPGSFRSNLLDALYGFTSEDYENVKISLGGV